jgi:anti-anti-sigma factor
MDGDSFEFEVKKMSDGVVILVVKGSLDDKSRSSFFASVQELIAEGFQRVIIDCEGLGFISSSGLAGLVVAKKLSEGNGGKVYLTHLNAMVADVLRLTKLNTLLGIHPTTRELLEKLGRIRHHPNSGSKGLSY